MQVRFNYSKLSAYLQCPLRYKYIYIDGLDRKYHIPKPYLSMGTSIHKALYHFFKTAPEERNLDLLHHLLRKYWVREDYLNEDEERDYGLRALDMLTDFYKKEDTKIVPDYLEKFFTIRLGEYMLSGKIDRIDHTPEGYEIIDYKTGNYILHEDEMLNDIQLPIYYLAAEEELGLEVKKITFLYLSETKRVSIDTKLLNKEEIKRKITKIIDQILADKAFAPQDNIFCSYCEFSVICPLKGTAPDVLEKKYDNIIANLYLLNQASKVLNMNVTNKPKLMETIRDTFVELLSFRYGTVITDLETYTPEPKYKNVFERALKTKHSEYELERAVLAIPLVFEDRVIAMVLLSSPKGLKPEVGDNIFTLANTLASSAAIALKNAELYELAIKDTLTRLYTRRFVLLRLEEEMEKATRYHTPLSVIMFDLDHFKTINDTYGHQQGDKVLKEFGSLLFEQLRTVDIPGRYGGEEFLVILPMTEAEKAFVAAERIRKAFAQKDFELGKAGRTPQKINITVSGGIAEYRDQTINQLIEEADRALYFSKDSGRNMNTIYTESMWKTMLNKIKGES